MVCACIFVLGWRLIDYWKCCEGFIKFAFSFLLLERNASVFGISRGSELAKIV